MPANMDANSVCSVVVVLAKHWEQSEINRIIVTTTTTSTMCSNPRAVGIERANADMLMHCTSESMINKAEMPACPPARKNPQT